MNGSKDPLCGGSRRSQTIDHMICTVGKAEAPTCPTCRKAIVMRRISSPGSLRESLCAVGRCRCGLAAAAGVWLASFSGEPARFSADGARLPDAAAIMAAAAAAAAASRRRRPYGDTTGSVASCLHSVKGPAAAPPMLLLASAASGSSCNAKQHQMLSSLPQCDLQNLPCILCTVIGTPHQ